MDDDDDFDILLQLAEQVEAAEGEDVETHADPRLPLLLQRQAQDDDMRLERAYGREALRQALGPGPCNGRDAGGPGPSHANSMAAGGAAAAGWHGNGSSSGGGAGSAAATAGSGVVGVGVSGVGFGADTSVRGGIPQPVQQAVPGGGYTETFSGLRVSRPVVGSMVVRDRLSDNPFFKLGSLGSSHPDGAWATVATLATKTIAEGRNGSTYSRWLLTDFAGTATLFLWGQAHQQLYKESEGSVLILYSPKLTKESGSGLRQGGARVTLTVDKPEQVQRIGASPDLAMCGGTKKDGSRCGTPVNRAECEYCVYHAQAALKKINQTGSRPELSRGGASYATKVLQRVAGKGPNLLQPGPKSPQRQQAGNSQDLRQQLHRVAERGRAATQSNSYRLLTAVAQAKEQEEEKVRDRDAGVGSKRSRSRVMGDGDDLPPGACEGPEDLDLAVQSGEVSVARAKLLQHLRHTKLTKEREQQRRQEEARMQRLLHQEEANEGQQQGVEREQQQGQQEEAEEQGLEEVDWEQQPQGQELQEQEQQGQEQQGQQQQRQQAGQQPQQEQQGQEQQQEQQHQQIRQGQQQAGRQQGVSADDDLEIVDDEAEDEPLAAGMAIAIGLTLSPEAEAAEEGKGRGQMGCVGAMALKCGGGCLELDDLEVVPDEGGGEGQGTGGVGATAGAGAGAGARAGAAAGAGAGAVGGPLQPSQKHNTAGGINAAVTVSGSGAKTGATAIATASGGGAKAAQGIPAATKPAAAVGTRPVAGVKTHHPGGQGSGGFIAVSGAAAAASTPGNSTAPSTGQRTAPGTALNPGPRTTPGTVKASAPGQHMATAAGSRTAPGTAKASAPTSAVRGRLVSGLGLKPHHPLAASLEARGQLTRASTAPAPAHAPPAGSRATGSGAGGRRGGVGGAAAAAAAMAVGVSRAAAAAAGTGRSAMQAAFGDLAGKVAGENCQSRYASLVEDAEFERLQRLMDEAERKDTLVQKLDSVSKLEVQAWHCPQCSRMTEHFDPACKGHGATRVRTTKRFWNCSHCSHYLTTLGVIHPKRRCPKCNDPGMDFKAATMYRGSRGGAGVKAAAEAGTGLAERQNFQARGVEHAFSLK